MNDSNLTSNRSLQGIYAAVWTNISLGIVGFILNVSVCLIICTHSILRQPFNYLILNLSLTDILLTSIEVINGVQDIFAITYSVPYRVSKIICYISVGFIVVSLPAACITLLIISIERYQAIAVVRFRKVQLSTVRKVIPIIWLLAVLMAIIPIVYADVELIHPNECGIGRIDQFHILILLLVSFSISSFVPIAIMLIIYVMIIHKLIQDLFITEPILSLELARREKKIRRTILPVLCISILSVFSTIPYLIINYYTFIDQYYNPLTHQPFSQKHRSLYIATVALFVLTPIINPLLYNLASSQFRKVLQSLICNRGHSTTTPVWHIAIKPKW